MRLKIKKNYPKVSNNPKCLLMLKKKKNSRNDRCESPVKNIKIVADLYPR